MSTRKHINISKKLSGISVVFILVCIGVGCLLVQWYLEARLIGGVKRGEYWAACKLINKQTDINLPFPHPSHSLDQTPLMYAAGAGNVKTMAFLLSHHANVNFRAFYGTALNCAAGAGKAKAVDVLLQAHADVNSRGIDEKTALMQASFKGHSEIVALLLAQHANTRLKNVIGETALDLAGTGQASAHLYPSQMGLPSEYRAIIKMLKANH